MLAILRENLNICERKPKSEPKTNTISKSLYCINRTSAHRLTVYATRGKPKLKVYATISIRNGINSPEPNGKRIDISENL